MRGRFTLIELLVVIAIIGILSSILLPSISNARAKGQLAVCLSNLKQWGQISFLHSNDMNQLFPQMFKHDGNGGTVARLINNDAYANEEDWKVAGTNWDTWSNYGMVEGVAKCPSFSAENINGNYTTVGWGTNFAGPYNAGSWGGFYMTSYMYVGGYNPMLEGGVHAGSVKSTLKAPPKNTSESDMDERALAADLNWYGGAPWNELRNINHRSEKGAFPRYQGVIYGDGHVSILKYKRTSIAQDYSLEIGTTSHYWHVP